MRDFKIITDCTSDLTDDLYKIHDIDVMPLIVSIGGKSYRDKIDINSEEMFSLVDKYKELPKTSAIPPAEFIRNFKQYIDKDLDILYIGIGSGFSSSYQNAMIAKAEFDDGRIRVVDSANLSSGIGLLLLKAVKFKKEGYSLDETADKLEKIVPYVRSMFSINTLEYLHKGGRCSGTARLFGTMLKIKPIVRVIDGKMAVVKKPRGKYKIALDTQLEYVMQDMNNIDPDNIFITHCLAHEDVDYLKTELEKFVKVDSIKKTYASSVISTHCGPRTIGILYIAKD